MEIYEYFRLKCDASAEGIFTGIYEAYAMHLPKNAVKICIEENPSPVLFTKEYEITSDEEKAQKVARTLQKKLGEENFLVLWEALYSNHIERGDAIFHVVCRALDQKDPKGIMEEMADPYVMKVFEMSRFTRREFWHLRGFLRFCELESGVLYGVVAPVNDVLPFLADHFSDRFPKENFLIYDKKRHYFIVHESGQMWYQRKGEALEEDKLIFSYIEENYRALFTHFCTSIGIKARTNEKLQQQMLPLRFRADMVEFRKKI